MNNSTIYNYLLDRVSKNRFLNGAQYGVGNAMTFYVFGKIKHRIFEAHVLLGAVIYSEVSAVGLWKAYRQKRYEDGVNLGFNIGIGYSFVNFSAVPIVG